MRNFSWIVISIAALSACDYDSEEELFPNACEEYQLEGLTYDDGISQILNVSCAIPSCHDGSSGLTNYSNYAAVKVIVDNGRLRERVIVDKDMPPSQPLHPCERQQLDAWLKDGAPEN